MDSILTQHCSEMAMGVSQNEATLLVTLILAFFIAPYAPKELFLLLDSFFIRLALLAGLIAAAYVSPVSAMLAFVLLAFLFIERNKLKMTQLHRAMQQSDQSSPAIAAIQNSPLAPPQPAFETPLETSHSFFPQNDSGDNTFARVAPTQDEKQPLATETSDGSDKAIEQLFEWVNPNLAQAP